MRKAQSLTSLWSGYIVVLFLLSQLVSCTNKPEPIPMDKLSKILTEMHIAESYSQYVPKDTSLHEISNKDSLKIYISAILAENKVSEAAFKQSIDWYKSRPELLDSVYQQVLTDIAIWQAKINKK